MPNWCSNHIYITGPEAKIRALYDAAIAAKGLLAVLNPQPESLEEQESNGMPAWWNWRVENWGTKWDIPMEALELEILPDGKAAITGFAESAWSPPTDAFAAYSFPNDDVYMELKYWEPGMDFIGYWNSDGTDFYTDGVHELVKKDKVDPMLDDLFEAFNVWEMYEDVE